MKGFKKFLLVFLALTFIMTSMPQLTFAENNLNLNSESQVMQNGDLTGDFEQGLNEEMTVTDSVYEPNSGKYIGEGFEVEFDVTSDWGTGFNGEITIINTDDEPIENWSLGFDFGYEISDCWTADIVEHEGSFYRIKNRGYNQDIAPGEAMKIGFQATPGNITEYPSNYELGSVKQSVNNEDYTIDFKVTSDWGEAFNGEITVTNNVYEPIEDWTLEFDFDRNIEQFWTADIVSHEGDHYVIKNKGYNSKIAYGETLTLGFSGNPGNLDSEPSNYVLNQVGYDIDYNKDTDCDGLPDWFEKELETDLNKEDTDKDGLPDGYEYFTVRTNLLKVDTDSNGIWDGEEDFDKDGLSNLDEYSLGTDPYSEDTDKDGLKDAEEVNVYGTDPMLYDTDGDGIGDSDEIKLGLNPLSKCTHNGILDSEYTIRQDVSIETLENINQDNKYKVAITVTAAGFVDSSIEVAESQYSEVLADNDAILGKVISIGYEDLKFEEATINFEIDNAIIDTENLNFPNEDGFEGIQRYQIFRYDKINAVLYPIQTEYDTINNQLILNTNTLGEYCIIDMDQWLYSLGVDFDETTEIYATNSKEVSLINNNKPMLLSVPEDEFETKEDKLPENYEELVLAQIKDVCNIKEVTPAANVRLMTQKASTDSTYNKQIDLVFVIDTSGSMSSKINQCKNYIKQLVQNLYNDGITARVAVVSFNDINNAIKTYKLASDDVWGKNPSEASQLINQITDISGGNENHGDALNTALNLDYRRNTAKFAVLLTDEPYNAKDNNSKIMASEIADQLASKGIITSVICRNYDVASFKPIFEETNGIQISVSSNFNTYLEIFIETVMRNNNGFLAIVPNSLTTISLKSTPSFNSSIKSDKDSLTDSEEIDWSLIKWDYNTLKLPTIQQYLKYIKARDIETFTRLSKEKADIINSMVVLPIKSDPTKEDSDRDGLIDGTAKKVDGKIVLPKDPEPLKVNGPIGIWQAQYEQEISGNIPKTLINSNYNSDIKVELVDFKILSGKVVIKITINDREIVLDSTNNPEECYTIYRDLLYGGAQVGSQILNFKLDDKEIALHSQVETWQWLGGYNDIYDTVFRIGTNGNMRYEKFPFEDGQGDDYIVWAWRGDYLNLGSGAEIGIYEKPIDVPFTDFQHWLCPSFTLPMTLNLYNYYGKNNIENIFCWAPNEEQWWITGFNPDFNQPNVHNMVSLGTIDFTGREDMFKSLKNEITIDNKLKDFMIFDEDGHTVWFIWWEKR